MDNLGRVVESREHHDNAPLPAIPAYHSVHTFYDEMGNIIAVKNATSILTTHDYDNWNLPTKTCFPDGTCEEVLVCDDRGRGK